MSIIDETLKFKRKYPLTIGWRLKRHAKIVEKHLNPDEYPLYTFVGQKNDNPIDIITSCVVVVTNKRIVIGRKRILFGYFFDSITPDLFNDLKVLSGLFWGKIHIDTVKEFITLSNIQKKALPEIETAITSFMMEQKKKYQNNNNSNEC